ncbi:hypothetical protein MSG28_009544 [Choristoneura fumiferana]|uniref:Uncharacterized protein n=1 Tax=Choristoneura fumiferana TaxID=7141 RepID=A0ACC0JBH3_CHOFU|nr:hypothetical protein MSG28_009544 [Choristoneura fumiferana]
MFTFISEKKLRQVNLKIGQQLDACFNWSMAPSQSELVVFARVSDPVVDLETTPPDGPWLEATAAAVPWSLGVDIAIWNAVAQARWGSVADRPHAFSLRPNSYIWIASSELFPNGRMFPREFTLFVSLRLRPELAGRGAARLVHAGSGASRSIYLAVPLYDFRWHHIAISVHDDNTVRAYVDCRWLRTDVLEKDALDTPRDADLIIGYLFSGDLEQMVLVPKAGQAKKQCSSQVTGTSTPYVNLH